MHGHPCERAIRHQVTCDESMSRSLPSQSVSIFISCSMARIPHSRCTKLLINAAQLTRSRRLVARITQLRCPCTVRSATCLACLASRDCSAIHAEPLRGPIGPGSRVCEPEGRHVTVTCWGWRTAPKKVLGAVQPREAAKREGAELHSISI